MPDIPGDLTTTALLIPGTPFASQFGDSGDPDPPASDVDWIGVDLVYGRTYLFVLDNDYSGAGADPSSLRLADSAGNEDLRFDRFGNRYFQITARYTGRHYLVANQGQATIPSDYTIQAFAIHDDNRGAAPILKIFSGFMLEHELSGSADADTFELVLPAARTWQIHVRGAGSGSGTLADPRLTIRKNGVVIGTDNDSGAGTDAFFQYTSSGPETLQITVNGTGAGSYRVIATVPDPHAADHTTTSNLSFGGTRRASTTAYIGHPADTDWHRIHLEADDIVKVAMRGTAAGDFLATPQPVMRSSTGAILGSAAVNDTTDDAIAFFYAAIPSTGGYYAIARTALQNYIGEYEISVEQVRTPFEGSFVFGQGRTNRIPMSRGQSVNLLSLLDLKGLAADSFEIWSDLSLREGSAVRAARTLYTVAGNGLSNWFLDAPGDAEAQIYLRGFAGRTWSPWIKFPVANLIAPANLVSANSWAGSDPITFRFASSLPAYYTAGEFGTFSAVSPASAPGAFFLSVASELSQVLGRRVEFAATGDPGDIQLFFGSGFSGPTRSFLPGADRGGDIILDSQDFSGPFTDLHRFRILRALGNALGLNFASSTSHLRSVMGDQVFAGGAAFPTTFGVDDYKAIYEKYGSLVFNPDDTATGTFVATLSPQPGIVTISNRARGIAVASGFNSDVLIDLRDGNRSGLRAPGVTGREIFIAPGAAVYNGTGGGGNDDLRGNDLENVLRGGNGNNIVTGHGGNDRMFAGTGNDTFIHRFGDGRDVVTDDGGEDTLCFIGTGIFRMDDLDAHYVFRRNGNFLDITPHLAGGLSEGFLRIDTKAGGTGRIEKLELWHENTLTSRISLVSVWNQLSDGQERRFALSGGSDQYGLLAAPV